MNYQLKLIKIPVKSTKTSLEFYTKLMDFRLVFLAEEYGWAQLESGDLSLALYEINKGGGQRLMGGHVDFHLALRDKDFILLVERLRDNHALYEQTIHKGDDGTTFVEALDPDHNIIKVFLMD